MLKARQIPGQIEQQGHLFPVGRRRASGAGVWAARHTPNSAAFLRWCRDSTFENGFSARAKSSDPAWGGSKGNKCAPGRIQKKTADRRELRNGRRPGIQHRNFGKVGRWKAGEDPPGPSAIPSCRRKAASTRFERVPNHRTRSAGGCNAVAHTRSASPGVVVSHKLFASDSTEGPFAIRDTVGYALPFVTQRALYTGRGPGNPVFQSGNFFKLERTVCLFHCGTCAG